MRWLLATCRALFVAAVMVAATVSVTAPAHAERETCPPVCDSIPASAWIEPTAIPLHATYRWPRLHTVDGLSDGRFRFEEICGTPLVPGDPRSYAVRSRALVAPGPGQWQLHAQVLHWRGDTLTGGSTARAVLLAAAQATRACQQTAPSVSPTVVVDEADRLAVVTSGSVIVHQYLAVHLESSTLSELAIWAPAPTTVEWPAVVDEDVFDSLTTPLCTAYVSSCG